MQVTQALSQLHAAIETAGPADETMVPSVALDAVVTEFERQRREMEFVEMLCDGGNLTVNGIPWREAFDRLNALVSDPVVSRS